MSSRQKAEDNISEAVRFFSRPENMSPRRIRGIFIPRLINQSRRYLGGLLLDLDSVNRRRLSVFQKGFLQEVFANAIAAKVQDPILVDIDIFFFLKKFKHLTEINMTIYSMQNFVFPIEELRFEVIKIHCLDHHFDSDPVYEILRNNGYVIKSLSLNNVRVTHGIIQFILRNPLTKLSLSNIKLETETEADAIRNIILNSEKLKKLKLVSARKPDSPTIFEVLSGHLFDHIAERRLRLREFSFTICQNCEPVIFDFHKLGSLEKLDVFYTVAKPIDNLLAMLEAIRELDESGKLHIPVIRLREYCDYYVSENWHDNYEACIPKSKETRDILKEIVGENIKICPIFKENN